MLIRGAYQGKTGFDTFSHKRSVMKRMFMLDVPQRYPPTTKGETKFLRLGIRCIDSSTLWKSLLILVVIAVILIAYEILRTHVL